MACLILIPLGTSLLRLTGQEVRGEGPIGRRARRSPSARPKDGDGPEGPPPIWITGALWTTRRRYRRYPEMWNPRWPGPDLELLVT